MNEDPAVDICFGMMVCDSILLTSSTSTNGWWIAYVITPKPVFYRRKNSPLHMGRYQPRKSGALDYYLKRWIPLDENIIF